MDLSSYDVILLNTSGGKDSMAAMITVVELATRQGVQDRIVAVHCDLGDMEWQGTLELAREHAESFGLRFEVVRNRNHVDLLARIEKRGKWPDAGNRYCTSEFKTGQVKRLATQLVQEFRDSECPRIRDRLSQHAGQVRILNVLGLRADESPARRKRPSFQHYEPKTGWSNGKRWVDEWLPIHDWGVDEVWGAIRQSGLRAHFAYDIGMPRLSCAFCVFASKPALILAAQHNPELAQRYVNAEARMGHTFRHKLSIAEVVEEAKTASVDRIENWSA
jgi:3'-phosphoadenosine 5'-phosphosulfate sulfotransferase (PAPS reductase)/FAD synthetase